MITMTEIARLTGVSQPTVSRVLNGNQAVNPEIRERVLACAREHNFQPNVIARSLAGSKTMLLGLVFTDISNSFFADLEKLLEQEAKKSGYSVIVFNSDYDWNREKECLDVIRRYRVDGLVIVPVEENSEKLRLIRIETKNPGEIRRTLRRHFEGCSGKTGIFAYNDRRAVQIHGILQGLGIEVPGRACLVGFDNTYICDYLYPGLSSVAQSNEEMAAKAVSRLLWKIEHPEDTEIIKEPIRARLIARQSSAAVEEDKS